MVFGQPGSGSDTLWLKPKNELHSSGVDVIADRFDAVRIALRIGFPGSRIPPIVLASIPTGIDPPVIEFDFLPDQLVDKLLLTCLVGLHPQRVRAIAEHIHGPRQLAMNSRQVISQHPAPPQILRPQEVIASPEKEGNKRRSDLLSRFQIEMRELLTGRNVQFCLAVPLETHYPFAGPAERQDHASVRHLEIVVGKRGVCGAAAHGGKTQSSVLEKRLFEWLVTLWDVGIASRIMKPEFRTFAAVHSNINSLSFFENRRIVIARIFEVQRPLDNWKV